MVGKENLGIQEFKNSGIRKNKIKARVVGGEVAEDLSDPQITQILAD